MSSQNFNFIFSVSSPKYHHTYSIAGVVYIMYILYYILYTSYKFYGQPDDGPLTRPKHVVVSYISLLSGIVVFIDFMYI